MSRVINKLNDRRVKVLTEEGMHSDGGGLYLRIIDGNKYWLFRYASRVTGKDRQYGIGPLHDFTLADAREKARRLRLKLRDGTDPLDEKLARRASSAAENAKGLMTFDACRDAYIAAHESTWSNRQHRTQWINSLTRYVTPVIGRLPVKAIDTTLVLKVLDPIWSEKSQTASRIRARMALILDWAKVRGYRDGENPAAWVGNLKHTLADHRKAGKVTHFAAIPYAEIGQFMLELRRRRTLAARALEFCVLTAVRSGDILGQKGDDARPPMRWEHLDMAAKVWTIPKTKSDNEHRVPLSPAALDVIRQMQAMRHDDRVFPIARFDRELAALRPGVTVHGFRSTFKDWASEITSFPREIIEKALAHAIGDETERAYQRGDLLVKRARLMDAWASYLDKPAAAAGGAGSVTPINRRKAIPG